MTAQAAADNGERPRDTDLEGFMARFWFGARGVGVRADLHLKSDVNSPLDRRRAQRLKPYFRVEQHHPDPGKAISRDTPKIRTKSFFEKTYMGRDVN